MSMQTLANEASLVMIAGAETTGAALSNALFYLITHPQCMTRLRAELDQAAGNDPSIDGSDSLDLSKLSELKYLQAVINETLRLMPAVPNGVQRTYPQENDPVLVAG
jgi:cytochrome P450